MNELPPPFGLYESVVTEGLKRRLQALDREYFQAFSKLDKAQAASLLSRHFRETLNSALVALSSERFEVVDQVALCNQLILVLERQLASKGLSSVSEADLVTPEMLLALVERGSVAEPTVPPRPTHPLTETHLLVNARGEHRIGHEIQREIESADRIDLLCSFLLWGGFRQLQDAIQGFLRKPGSQMRVLTTVYMGATEARVLDALQAMGADVGVSYDTRRTRLHAKAWLFHRHSGFSTGYVGSSNLSAAALTEGLEWNVRVGSETPSVLSKFRAAFEGYWNDPSFERYDAERDGARLRAALSAETSSAETPSLFFDLRPYPFQQAIMERLEAERFVHGRLRNLVVAATGTGKTMLAAFDFARLRKRFQAERGRWPRLLFLAHRRELLQQALTTFRHVLKDATFGDLFVAGKRPSQDDAVFASVQTLGGQSPETVASEAWDIVIVDEFHHAEAASYEKWLAYLRPWILVGLTATPERGDGRDILHWFGGHTAVELRLWDAIEQSLLVPFQYFGLKDSIDVSAYWKRGQFDYGELDGLLGAHQARALQVLNAVETYVANPSQMRAIGFCVGRGHARFMAESFTRAGLRAATALGTDTDREQRVQELQSGKLQALFTVDVLSEGVDIPEVDTALFLRPTESPTVFIQQLGRGLRLCAGKRCLTVVDLVSTPDRTFRLDRKYLALLGGSRRQLESQVESDFPLLPAGCAIQLTDDAKAIVLENLRQAIGGRTDALVAELKRLGPATSLRTFLAETGLAPRELYKKRCMTDLRVRAGIAPGGTEVLEPRLARAIARLVDTDDPILLRSLCTDLEADSPPSPSPSWQMVLATLYGNAGFREEIQMLRDLWRGWGLRRELHELFEYLEASSTILPTGSDEPWLPLRVRCQYRQEQIVGALTRGDKPDLQHVREGVWFVERRKLDIFFVTLQKEEKDFSPTTMYKDYAISPELFHWQSQSTTKAGSKIGQRHIQHRELEVTPLLFARVEAEDERGEANPYRFLGPVEYVSHEGEKPMSITWRLKYAMPAAFFEESRVAV